MSLIFKKEGNDCNEFILQEQDNIKFILSPRNSWDDIWDLYNKHQEAFWRSDEIQLSDDLQDWHSMTSEEKHLITMILAFFAASDGIVNENLLERFMSEIKVPEMKAFYGFQFMIENIHARTYAMLIETYVPDITEQNHLLNGIVTIESVKLKAKWTLDWISNEESAFAQRLLAFCFVEGLFFSASFCAIFWFREKGKLPGLAHSNELIARDEGLHTEAAILLYQRIVNRVPQDIVFSMVKDAMKCEEAFVKECFKIGGMIGMNESKMIQYTHFIADYLLTRLGYEKLFKESNPFPWMHLLSIGNKSNFFERSNGDYKKSNLNNSDILDQISFVDINDI